MEHVLVNITVPSFEWSGKYGLLVEARTVTAYSNLTHKTYVEPGRTEPNMTDPSILATYSDFDKGTKKSKWNGLRTPWYIQQGAL